MDKRIETALRLIDGAMPGPFRWYWTPSGSMYVGDDAGLISTAGAGILLDSDGGNWPEPDSPDARLLEVGVSVLPAALRLAAAVDEHLDEVLTFQFPEALDTALTEFLALLPEPPSPAVEEDR